MEGPLIHLPCPKAGPVRIIMGITVDMLRSGGWVYKVILIFKQQSKLLTFVLKLIIYAIIFLKYILLILYNYETIKLAKL